MNREIIDIISEYADLRKGEDIKCFDVRNYTTVSDYVMIVTALNKRHVAALAKDIEEKTEELGFPIKSKEGFRTTEWVLLDFGDLVVHVFDKETRNYYGLERLLRNAELIAG